MTTYRLTLTASERQAIDWLGVRYPHGQDFREAIARYMNDGGDWDSADDVTFFLPEHAAWTVKDLGDADDQLWACFSGEFRRKMVQFCDSII